MRKKRTSQASIFEYYSQHESGLQLSAISDELDALPVILDLAANDLIDEECSLAGANGLTVESIVRAAFLKQMMSLSYQDLSFYIDDSLTYRSFSRITEKSPSSSTLQATISRISPETWERINKVLLLSAKESGVEKARTVRIDSTVTDANIHPPTDSSLLWDGVRVVVRLLEQASQIAGRDVIVFKDHSRVAKKRMRSIVYTRGKDPKKALYRDLVNVSKKTLGYLVDSEIPLKILGENNDVINAIRLELMHYKPLFEAVIDQTERRVFQDEKVPATEKIVSIFEPHTDVIIKGSRGIQYGHKLNISTGKSGLVLDVFIEDGNPADTARLCPMIERQQQIYGRIPRQVAADGGYASVDNLATAKNLGVKDVAFHKKRGLKVKDMVKSEWVYKKLCNFRAGIEGNISCLKRRYGLSRCTWKGLDKFKAFVWSSSVAYNFGSS